MENKLKELTDKIYQEGLEKAKVDSDKILKEAKTQAETKIAESTKEAERIIKEAKAKAKEITENSKNDVKMAGKQAITTLKQKIYSLVSADVLKENLGKELNLSNTLKEIIIKLLENWKNIDNAPDLDIIISDDLKEKVENSFLAEIQKAYNKEVKLEFSENVKAGFIVKPQDGSFILSFTDEDFLNLFKSYLRPNTIKLLF